MTGRKKFIYSLLMIVLIFALFIVFFLVRSYWFAEPRTADSLLNQYYELVKYDPDTAKKTLDIILKQYPNNKVALREMGNWYIKQGDTRNALKQFKIAQQRYPNDKYVNRMLSQLTLTLNIKSAVTDTTRSIGHDQVSVIAQASGAENSKSDQDNIEKNLFDNMLANHSKDIVNQVLNPSTKVCFIHSNTYENLTTVVNPAAPAKEVTISERDQLLNEFYMNKSEHPQLAWIAIKKLLQHYPNDLAALKEAGYFALSEKKNKESVQYFEKAYALSRDPLLALQVGYILDGLGDKPEAYYYFDLATRATTPEQQLKAELAKTNLRGLQVKYLPDPFFADLLYYPFYRSRFKLMIYPLIARVGVVINKEYNIKMYLGYRRTSDNKSTNSGELPQIYEDDAAITSLGLQAGPFPKLPLSGFIEAGKAVDLVYKSRSRWRNDFRSGVVYYNDWGKEARYTFDPHFTLKPNMDLYADMIYFSRYTNTIATARARPGVEIFRSGSTSLNLYLKMYLSEDYDRLYYNDIFEMGPSLALTPSDRYNVTFRYECLHGYYLPSGNSQVNPYSKEYHNNMIFLDTYVSV